MTPHTTDGGRSPDGSGSRPSDGAASVSTVPASIPNAACKGKRGFSSHAWATKGLRAIEREHNHDARRGHLHVYKCDECLGWHIGRGFAKRDAKQSRRQPAPPTNAGRSGALVFAEADRIAKQRFPNGANASQFGLIVREVLTSAIEAQSAKTEGLGPKDESAVAKPDAHEASHD